jgi:hypothetical protein
MKIINVLCVGWGGPRWLGTNRNTTIWPQLPKIINAPLNGFRNDKIFVIGVTNVAVRSSPATYGVHRYD